MAPRHWTILVIPPGNEPTRSFVVTQRARKALGGATGAVAALLAAAVFALTSPYATPAGRIAAAENARLRARLAEIDVRLAAVNDTLSSIGTEGQHLRQIAGLPDAATSAALIGTNTPAPGGAHLQDAPLAEAPLLDATMRRATELAATFRAVSDTLARSFERLARTPSIMPTAGWLSSHFSASRLHPVLHENRGHEGIDLGAPMGAPIVAPASGTVRTVAREDGFGNTFEIDHGDGIVTRFAHCSRIVVRVGQVVTRGQLIATVGNTGLSTGPHLHYEVHVNGQAVDPLRYVVRPRGSERVADAEGESRP